jgi:peptidoglycan/LPS O-acetylase OafA/YrhL
METKYVKQLDGLRFYAVVMIMIAHWLQWQWKNELLLNIPFTHGVVLFFVLSGYLISRILFLNKEKYELKIANRNKIIITFYIRRILRIFPVYYLTILFLLIINHGNISEIFPWLISYTSNIYQSIYNLDIQEFNHFWSLAVEEQFYIFWPIVLLFTKSRTLIVIVFTIVLALLAKSYIFLAFDNWRANSYFTICCMHSLGIGSLLAYCEVYKNKLIQVISKPIYLKTAILFYIFLLFAESVLDLPWYKQILDEFIFAIISALLIIRASVHGFSGITKLLLENKFICYSGKISYGMYIFHLFIPEFVLWLFPNTLTLNQHYAISKYVLFVIYYFITFSFAHLSFKYLETPINNIKNKFPY